MNGSPIASGDCIANRATASRTVSSNRRFRVLPVEACIRPRSPSFSNRSNQRRTVARSTSRIAAISLSGRPSLRARMIRAWRLRLGLPSLAIQCSSPSTSSDNSMAPGRRAARVRAGPSSVAVTVFCSTLRVGANASVDMPVPWLAIPALSWFKPRCIVDTPEFDGPSCTPVSTSQQVTVIVP